MIPAYNCSAYLREAIESVLVQDEGTVRMQIEVCDDASSDANVKQIVEEVGGGRVSYFRQESNVGSLRNFETCLNRSRGRLIHLLHGDDKIRPGFYRRMEALFSHHPDIGMGFCRYYSIDQEDITESLSDLERVEAGILDNWLSRIACRQRIQVPAVVVPRKIYERLGSFYGVHYGEDWEMWIRIAAHYPVGYVPEPLADYRKHNFSITGQYVLTGQNIRDLKKVMEISRQYFSAEQWQLIHKKARRFYAQYAINTARKIWGRCQNGAGTRAQIRAALALDVSGDLIYQAAKLYAKMALHIKR
jgi:glycosyltransferase involved in cell wall biosynthesis